MAVTQTTILASGTTAATSTNIVVDALGVAKVAIFSAEPGASMAGNACEVHDVTPGAPNWVGALNQNQRSMQLYGPGTYRVVRPVLPVAFGVCLDT